MRQETEESALIPPREMLEDLEGGLGELDTPQVGTHRDAAPQCELVVDAVLTVHGRDVDGIVRQPRGKREATLPKAGAHTAIRGSDTAESLPGSQDVSAIVCHDCRQPLGFQWSQTRVRLGRFKSGPSQVCAQPKHRLVVATALLLGC